MSRSETCSACGEEVRWGTRLGRTMYLHRTEVDHLPVLGNNAPVALVRTPEEPPAEPVPEPEILSHSIEISDLRNRSGVKQVANLVIKHGWELVSLTHARGPYVGSKGTVLSISDVIVLRARDTRLDEDPTRMRGIVASWRDYDYDFGYALSQRSPHKVNATELKEWIKGEDLQF